MQVPLLLIFWNQSITLDIFLHWLQCNFSDGFINIFYNGFSNFPKFTLSWVYEATFEVDNEAFFMFLKAPSVLLTVVEHSRYY